VTYDEWAMLVEELNMAYPHQQIDQFTAEVWFRALKDYTLAELSRALERCLREREFISTYALAEAVKDDRRERSAVRSTVLPLPATKAPPPLEWIEIRKTLERSKLLPGHPDHLPGPEARKRIDQLARDRDARMAEGTTAPRRERP
jgi:hypothetical protein